MTPRRFVILERECLLPPEPHLRDLQALPVLLARLNGPAVRLDGPRELHGSGWGSWIVWLPLAVVAAVFFAGGC